MNAKQKLKDEIEELEDGLKHGQDGSLLQGMANKGMRESIKEKKEELDKLERSNK